MKRPFMVWIGFISICCSKVAKEGKSCPRLLVLQRVAQNAKSCSKFAERNLFMPTPHAPKRHTAGQESALQLTNNGKRYKRKHSHAQRYR